MSIIRTNAIRQNTKAYAISRSTGSVMPFVAVSMIFLLGTVGIASELTRIFETVRQLNFAAQSAGLYGCSLAVNSNGTYSVSGAQANIQNAVLTTGTAAWNQAQCGPTGNIFGTTGSNTAWSEAVSFAAADIQFVNNPLDASEFFTQVTARRQGGDALQTFFLPLLWLYSNPIGTKLPSGEFTAGTYQTAEILGQPASRVGAGGALTTSTSSSSATWAVLPIAISNQEFAAIANPSQTNTTYNIDLVSPNTTASSGDIAGCLVNVAAGTGTGSAYYGNGTGNTAINQLIGLLNYFAGNAGQSVAPAMVEAGSQLNAFDPTDPGFVSQQSQVTKALTNPNLPNKFYIMPVLAADPVFGSTNTVIGFARLNLDRVNVTGNTVNSITVDIGESVPIYNTSCVGGLSAIPGNTSNLLPAPVAPFLPRQYDPTTGGVTARPRGIILAPALSPRQITFS